MFGATNLASGLTAGTAESRPAKQIIIVGNTHIDYNQYHGNPNNGSIYYDGDGDGLQIIGGSDFDLDGDYTIEMVFRPGPGDYQQEIITNRQDQNYGTGEFYIEWNAELNKIQWGVKGLPTQFSDQRFQREQWFHLALVRNSDYLQLYIHGWQQGASFPTSTANDINSQRVGGKIYTGLLGGILGGLKGHMAEIRISKSARYTPLAVAPDPVHTNDEDTLLLIHGSGALGENIILDDNR